MNRLIESLWPEKNRITESLRLGKNRIMESLRLEKNRITESLQLEKTFKIIKPNLDPSQPAPTKPHCKGLHITQAVLISFHCQKESAKRFGEAHSGFSVAKASLVGEVLLPTGASVRQH